MKKEQNNPSKLDFIDRDDVRKEIRLACQQLFDHEIHFEIISIYGAGGTGKTFLLEEQFIYNHTLHTLPVTPIYMTLEMTGKDDLLDILIKFRKALPKDRKYPMFDYAMLHVWNSLNTGRLDEDFLKMTKTGLLAFFKPFLAVAAKPFMDLPIGEIIEMGINLSDKLVEYYNDAEIEKTVKRLGNISTHDLLQELPHLLGADIHKAFLNDRFALVIDSYQPYSEQGPSPQWLISLIEKVHYGVYILTSREKIVWPESLRGKVHSFNLAELPPDEVRTALKKQFPFEPELIEHIIQITDCIPIYLDLAVRTLHAQPCKKADKADIFFKSKDDVVRKFLSHLREDERTALTVLAIVQIFDRDIFEHLMKDLNLPMPIFSFEEICERTLVRNYEEGRDFYKIHDVISENICYITEPPKIHRVICSYLSYLNNRGSSFYDSLKTNMLLKHVLSIYAKIGIPISKVENEQLLDLYFVGKEALLPFNCNGIDGFESSSCLKDLYYFLRALSEERANSNIRLAWLNQIDEATCLFGKHLISLKLMKGYLRALCEGTQYLKQAVEEINPALSDEDCQEWYYGQTKIFLGDCMVSYGRYQYGIHELETYRQLLPRLIWKATDAFQVGRHIGHAYRFNMLLDEAEKEYSSLLCNPSKDSSPTALQRVYIYTNLCETYCYFSPEKVFKLSEEALELSNSFNDLKSKGKIYYSLAIACLHEKDYNRARSYIGESLAANKEDGYIAGQLYAYMAQSYLEYATKRKIDPKTLGKIECIIQQIEVYSCFRLPIALMQEDYRHFEEIRASQEWLDFDKTAVNYRTFLDSLI